jgi:hypothetical protein
MTKITKEITEIARKKAQQSQCRNRVSALGLNKNGDCVMKTFNLHRFGRKGGGVHAEMQILAKAREKGVVSIIICRVGKGGDLLPIDPCETCQETADKLGVKISTVGAS